MFTPPDEANNLDIEAMNDSSDNLEVIESDVHAMPQKFRQAGSLPKKKGRLNWFIIGSIIVVALAAIIVVAIMFFSSPQEVGELPDLSDVQVNGNQNVNSNQNTNQADNQDSQQQTADSQGGRDLQRITDVSQLRTALLLHFNSYQVFPTDLDALAPEFLSEVPINPRPGGLAYEYLPEEDQLNYQLKFALEQGGLWGVARLRQGSYIATASGITPEEVFRLEQDNQDASDDNQNSQAEGDQPQALRQGLDTDSDQLTDIEENIYQTNSTNQDTDGDGFNDAQEILNHYDPTSAEGRLIDSSLIEIYQNPSHPYSLFYPKVWSARSLTANDSEVIFTATTGEFIEVIVADNPLGVSAYNWYLAQNNADLARSLRSLMIGGFPAVQTEDGLNTYVSYGSKIYIITYNIGTQQQMNFQTTYQLVLNSFIFFGSPENQETGSNQGDSVIVAPES